MLLPAALYTVFWDLHQTDPHFWTAAKCSQVSLLWDFESCDMCSRSLPCHLTGCRIEVEIEVFVPQPTSAGERCTGKPPLVCKRP